MSAGTRRALWLLGLGAAGGLILIAVISRLPDPPADDVDALVERLHGLLATLAVLAVPLVIACAVLWQTGQRAAQTGRFPPAGAAVLGRRPALTGGAAVRRGRALQAVALLVGLTALLTPLALWLLLRHLLG